MIPSHASFVAEALQCDARPERRAGRPIAAVLGPLLDPALGGIVLLHDDHDAIAAIDTGSSGDRFKLYAIGAVSVRKLPPGDVLRMTVWPVVVDFAVLQVLAFDDAAGMALRARRSLIGVRARKGPAW